MLPDQRGVEQRLVALHVDDDLVVGEAQQLRGLGQAVGARRVIGARHARRDAVRDDRIAHALVVGGDDDARRAACQRALGHAHDHRLAGDVGQRLARQARRRVARRNQDGEIVQQALGHARAARYSYSAGVSLRASSSSITGMPSRTG